MFPVTEKCYQRIAFNSRQNRNTRQVIKTNCFTIRDEAQEYLYRYEQGERTRYCVDIEVILNQVLPHFA